MGSNPTYENERWRMERRICNKIPYGLRKMAMLTIKNIIFGSLPGGVVN